MLKWRLISAAVILTIVLSLVYLDWKTPAAPGIWLFPIGLFAALMGTGEIIWLIEQRHTRLRRPVIYFAATAVMSCTMIPVVWNLMDSYPVDCPVGRAGWPLLGFALGILAIFLSELIAFREPGEVLSRVSLSMFAVVYPSLLFSFAILLRLYDSHAVGMAALVSMIVIVKIADSGAYFGGRALGKRKMAPYLSPGKTIAGGVSGLASGAIACLVFFYWIAPATLDVRPDPSVAWWRWALMGLIVAVAGTCGDLAESMIKRDAGQKDSSRWLPGLGGVLDVIDSLLSGAPAAYACWIVGLVKLA